MIRSFPFTLVPLILYNVVVFLLPGLIEPDQCLTQVFSVGLFSGALWTFTFGDLMVTLGLAMLFIEIINAASVGRRAVGNHVVSILVLLVYAIEFLVVQKAATSAFFNLMLISLIDVLAGVVITIRMASRDVSIGNL